MHHLQFEGQIGANLSLNVSLYMSSICKILHECQQLFNYTILINAILIVTLQSINTLIDGRHEVVYSMVLCM
jgi:hypothetical protein